MIKYFLINNASRAAAYGIGTYLKQMTDFIKTCMPQFELFFLDIYSDVKEFTIDKDENGIIHYKIPAFNVHNKAFLYYRSILFFLSQHISQEEKIILHFNYSQHYDLIRLFKANYSCCKIVFTIHYMDWCFALNGDVDRFREIVHYGDCNDELKEKVCNGYNKEKQLFSICDKVLVLSNFTYDVVVNDYKINEEKVHIVHNSICESSENADGKEKHIAKPLNIIYVGRLDEAKGVGFAIQAFEKLYRRNEHIRLTIAGDGIFSEYFKLCRNIRYAVTFTGFIGHDEISNLLKESYIGVLPSFNEQCSYSALELMSAGVPFITTDSTGMREMMERTPENMLHVNYCDFKSELFIDELSKKMEALIDDKEKWEQASKNLLSLFYERYSKERLHLSMTQVFNSSSMSEKGLSHEFLPYLDAEFVRIIDTRPAIDMDNVGLTGIGCYLWWRIGSLKVQEDKSNLSKSLKLQEYLIYYIDWVFDVLMEYKEDAFTSLFEIDPLNWLLVNLKESGFYQTKVDKIIRLTHSIGIDIMFKNGHYFDALDIPRTALKIYNLNL